MKASGERDALCFSDREAFAARAKRAYTGAMCTAKKIRYRLEWRKFATQFFLLLSRKACYRAKHEVTA
jgi:hypothetical protein